MRAATVALLAVFWTVGCGSDARESAVGISVDGCLPAAAEGSGVVIADDLVLTSAHVLRGAESITVEWTDGRSGSAVVVGFDPEMDLAYLATPTEGAPPLRVASEDVGPGDLGQAWVVRDGELVTLDVRIERSVRINTEDIYVEGETERPGWDLEAEILPGDSGGAVIVDGAVAGVLWARSRGTPGRSYAIDPSRAGDRIERQLREGSLGPGVDLTRCT